VIERKFRATAVMDPPLPGLRSLPTSPAVNSPSTLISEFLEWFGDLGIFVWQVLRASVTPPFEFRELFRQLDEIGSKSLPLVALAGAATEGTQQ
jgi:ABC-type transporter Mla maintaining outer membrane lipid asymmetry permease subunit MlaE